MTLKKIAIRLLPVAGVLCLVAASLPVKSATAAPSYRVLVSGLDNPRGLAWDAAGQLWVAEAGKGGSGPCTEGPEGDKVCVGLTGAITRVYQGHAQRIVSGLPSAAGEDGNNAGGPHDVAVMHPGELKVVFGLGGNAEERDKLGAPATSLGRLVQFSHQPPGLTVDVDWNDAVDLAAHEQAHNPDGGENDSNPYAVIADAAGNAVVADAGGNDLLKVGRDGQISTLAVFPDRMVDAPAFLGLPPGTKIPMQSVPTTVARGKHGEYYVGELTGFPFAPGAARIYLVNDTPNAKPQVFAEGFTNIIDLAVGKDGSLYVLEIAKDGLLAAGESAPTGELIRISPNGERTVLMTDGLVAPTGLAIGPDNALYVSNYGTFAGKGEILRISPVGLG
jgi:hypothetical protein